MIGVKVLRLQMKSVAYLVRLMSLDWFLLIHYSYFISIQIIKPDAVNLLIISSIRLAITMISLFFRTINLMTLVHVEETVSLSIVPPATVYIDVRSK